MTIFKSILCAVDFSPLSRRALMAAAGLAASADAALVVVTVWDVSMYGGAGFGSSGPSLQAMSDADVAMLADWQAQAIAAGAARTTTRALTGQPWDELVQLAGRAPAADLIVIGTHGRGRIAHALLGSVAERVVRHAPCAVLVIR